MATSIGGEILERWTGFCSKALAGSQDWPALQDLLDVARTKAADERELAACVARGAEQLDVAAPVVALDCVRGFSDLPVEERHAHEHGLAVRAVASVAPTKQPPVLTWLPNGRPRLAAEDELDISFSHEGLYCMCAVGPDAQGCDLAAISQRSQAYWHSLLGSVRAPLLEALKAEDTLDIAGTRIWAALEAVRKGVNTIAGEELTIVSRADASVLFRARTLGKEAFVLTLPIRFSHGPQSMIALIVKASPSADEGRATIGPAARIVHDDRLGCDVVEYEFRVTWKECTTPSRKAMAVCYVDWFHRTREAMLPPQDTRRWIAGVLDGTAGLVARSIRVHLYDDVTAHDQIRARIWVSHMSDKVAGWRADYFKTLPTGADKRVATVEAEGGIVGVGSNGSRSSGASGAVRDYGRFLQTRGFPPAGTDGAGFDELQKGRPIFEIAEGPRSGPLLFTETMRPSSIDSDLVGNVSSITFFGWLAHVRDRFLHSVLPNEMVRRVGASAETLREALCTGEEMVYLREAFPFDDIKVEMRLMAATENSVKFRYEFLRAAQGASEKIAVGQQQLVWVRRDNGAVPRSDVLPAELRDLLKSPRPPAGEDMPRMLEVGP